MASIWMEIKENHTYRISTLSSKHRTPDQLHGLLSMGSQSWNTPWGSASTLTFSSSNANPNIQLHKRDSTVTNHKKPNPPNTTAPPMPCPISRLASAKQDVITFTVDRSRADAGLCLEQQHEEGKQQLEPSRALAKPPPRTHGNGSASSRRIATREPGASSLPTVAGRASASQVPNALEDETGPPLRSTTGHGNVGSAWRSVACPLHRHHAGENRRRAASVVSGELEVLELFAGAHWSRRTGMGSCPLFPARRFSRRED